MLHVATSLRQHLLLCLLDPLRNVQVHLRARKLAALHRLPQDVRRQEPDMPVTTFLRHVKCSVDYTAVYKLEAILDGDLEVHDATQGLFARWNPLCLRVAVPAGVEEAIARPQSLLHVVAESAAGVGNLRDEVGRVLAGLVGTEREDGGDVVVWWFQFEEVRGRSKFGGVRGLVALLVQFGHLSTYGVAQLLW